MKLAIMQPYFLPYIGYYQLISAVDLFIVYDNVKYVKKGWINRNRMLVNGKDALFSLPLKKDSDALDIRDRELAADFDRAKLLNQWQGAYRTAPFFKQTFPLLEEIVGFQDPNLFRYLFNSLQMTCEHLGLKTSFKISSEVPIDHSLKFQDRVLALCEAEGTQKYINAIGGLELYDANAFSARGIEFRALRARPFPYQQFGQPHVPYLSIVDLLMFNSVSKLGEIIAENYDLVQQDV
ncbi:MULTISPECIES: WbqC family protein [Bradyrhizobium]|uniref:WbqC family protein n=1 Tax=Bradyrhizobium TaxID=374 RepID=UPI001EDC26CB|nr:WbqC family protein [Bradyrhizobium zhengyangense]MCG2644012.1 WbqC family protein [Bradyrhizobium zhengyangense]